MRGAILAVTLLLLLAPLGLAQQGDGDGGPEGPSSGPGGDGDCSRAPDPKRCEMRQRCREQPDDPRCPRDGDGPDGNATDDPEGSDDGRDGRFCDEDNRTEEQKERCEKAVQEIRDDGRPRDHITFTVDAANGTLRDYTIDGLVVLSELRLELDGGNLTIDRQGSVLRVLAGDDELRLHDDPTGLIRFKGDAGNVTFVFPPTALPDQGEHGARIGYGDGRDALLLADNATWLDAGVVRLTGFFAFHVPPHGAPAADRPADPEVEERKQEAIERRTLGAEITLKPRDAAAAGANASIEILAYDDVDVDVHLPEGGAGEDAPLRVVVSSELGEGRTIVLNVDEALLASTDPGDLVLRYFDVDNGSAGGPAYETEVLFKQADGLQDVLEPADDGGQPEYWVVEDANGVQVLVSVPHWSSHAITVASIATVLHAPSVTVGIVAGAAASIAMAALLVWPRRRDDEL